MAVTWNPADKNANVTLSNSDLTASCAQTSASNDGNGASVRGTDGKSAGKWYWEVHVDSAANTWIGFANASFLLSKYPAATLDSVGFNGSGNGVRNSSGLGISVGVIANGDVLSFALDMGAGTCDVRRNNGTPATVTAGNMPSGTIYPAVGVQNGGATPSLFTARFRQDQQTYAPPAGYAPLDPASLTNSSAVLPVFTGSGSAQNGSVGSSVVSMLKYSATASTPPDSVCVLPRIIASGFALQAATGAATLPKVRAAGTADAGSASASDELIPFVVAAGVAMTERVATSSATLPRIRAAGATLPLSNSAGVVLPGVHGVGVAVAGTTGVSTVVLPLYQVAGTLFVAAIGTSTAVVVPRVRASGFASQPQGGQALAFQTQLQAITVYTNFNFNSFARFNGVYLAAGPGGLYTLGGDTDDGAPITATLRPGISDFGTAFYKQMHYIYVGYRTTGNLIFRVYADGKSPRDYLLQAQSSSAIRRARVRVGRGLAASYWQFEVQNVNGADFSLNMIEAKAVPLHRRFGRA